MITSIVIPTYNRAEKLKITLESIKSVARDPQNLELIIVDNNSIDSTKQVVETYGKKNNIPIHYLLETKRGLHYARNTGIATSSGDVILFLDDDVLVKSNIFSAINEEFQNHPSTAIAGLRVEPGWESEPPPWVSDFEEHNANPALSYLNYGNRRKVIRKKNVFGCGMAVRRKFALEVGGSARDTYSKKYKFLQGSGENHFINQARDKGLDIVYLPDAILEHHIPNERLTVKYFLDRYERFAYEAVDDVIKKYSLKHSSVKIAFNSFYHGLINLAGYFKAILRHGKYNKKYKEYYLIISYYYWIQIVQTLRLIFNRKIYLYLKMVG